MEDFPAQPLQGNRLPRDRLTAQARKIQEAAGHPVHLACAGQDQADQAADFRRLTCAVAVAQGTHIGIVAGEFGGNAITAVALPATSGAGTPQITDWVTCNIASFSNGFDPHTTTAYQSPNGAKDAIAVLANWVSGTAGGLAVVDLTKMLNKTLVPRTAAGHGCASGTLPGTVATLLPIP